MKIKRDKHLIPVSKEHHHALLLCWKIRRGIKNEVNPIRIKKYIDLFYEINLVPHFEIEEKYIFPILPKENEFISRVLNDHDQVKRFIANENPGYKELEEFAKLIDKHVRFEERMLFNEIQKVATKEQLELIEKNHQVSKCINDLDDVFW